ncbi:MAG: IS630 family transposase [Chloroflexi bacterium]|nr:IS630 family transposase [Chloroflexota bacterium]
MVFVRPLDDRERQQLRRLTRQEVGRVSERIRMILLSNRGYTVPQIAAIFECAEATVRHWIARFDAQGMEGRRDRPRPGRPRKADAAARQTIAEQVTTPPSAAGYACGFWTVVTLAAHLATGFGLKLSRATLRRVLLALDFCWRRPRHVLPDDPAAASKRWSLCQRVLAAPQDTVLLCQDECDVHVLPVLRAMWMRRGQQARIPTPGTNRKRAVFGALEPATGRWLYQVTQRKRAVEFIAFLECVLLTYPDRAVLVILDNASIHTAKAVRAWLADHPRLDLLFLPCYSGQEHNPVEKVWWRLKDRVAANRLHGSIEALVEAVHEFFGSFTPEAALQLAA